jgi:hypothetical protein
MTEADDDYEDDDWEPTPEEKEAIAQQVRLAKRFPTFVLLARAMMRHSRYERLKELGAPPVILEKSNEDRVKSWNDLCAAFPRSEDARIFMLEDVLSTIRDEFVRPHDSSKTDA